jgi:predicted Zn-dependent peptidase
MRLAAPLLLFGSFFCANPQLFSREAVDEVVPQNALTSTTRFQNGAVFIQRDLPGSEIVHLEVNVKLGQADLPENKRAINGMTFDLMTMATKKFPKKKIFEITEKYSIGLQCNGGIEQSGCEIDTVVENFERAFDLVTSSFKEPLFEAEDIVLTKQRRTAQFQQETQNPEQFVNSLVNTIFYPPGHPYRHIPVDAIAQIKDITASDLVNYHKSLLNSHALQVVYVGPKLSGQHTKMIESFITSWKGTPLNARDIPAPKFDPKSKVVFEHRAIPTAYIRAKFNAPGVTSKDHATSKVLFEILGEELHEEVRTKRSLSYSIGALTLQLEQGIGILVASTSKPKETIATIAEVLKKVSSTLYSQEKLNEYKNVFTTSHYLTMESHNSFAGALAASAMYFNDANLLYQFPKKIRAVNPADVQKLAKETLTKIRIGIIYDKEKFKPEWTEPLTSL